VQDELSTKSILVTGGTGSFGLTFIKRALDTGGLQINSRYTRIIN
jgi:FlaA1/EpsC-like NDP-sugar epimerase